MVDGELIRQRWALFGSKLDERGRRLFAAAEAKTAGRGGGAAVSAITGIARSTIGRGLHDLETKEALLGGGFAVTEAVATRSPTSIRP
jgi:hypothetical protein